MSDEERAAWPPPGERPEPEVRDGWLPPVAQPSRPAPEWVRADPPQPGALQLAPYGQRAAAAAIDFMIRLAIALAGAALGSILFVAGTDAGVTGLIVGAIAGAAAGTLLYAPIMLARTNGQTVGHRTTGTRIVMADGSRMTGGKAFLREVLVKSVLMEGIGGLLLYVLTIVNYTMPLWDDGNQALHDKICGTRVVMD